MSTKHNEPVASHGEPISVPHITIEHPTIAQSIQQMLQGNPYSDPSSLVGSTLKGPFQNPGAGALQNLVGHFDPGSSDPSKGSGSQSDPLAVLAGDAKAALARLNNIDLSNHPDPTQKPGFDIGGGLADTLKTLVAQAGLNITQGKFAAPAQPGSDTTGQPLHDGHPVGMPTLSPGIVDVFGQLTKRPDGPPPEPGSGSKDPGHDKLGGMLAKSEDIPNSNGGVTTHGSNEYVDKDGHRHKDEWWVSKDSYKEIDKDLKTGKYTLDYTDFRTGYTAHQANGILVTHGEHDLKTPDGDHRSTLPSWLANQIAKETHHAVESMRPPSGPGENVNVAGSDIPGTVSTGDLKGVKVNGIHDLLGGDNSLEGSQERNGGVFMGPAKPNPQGPDIMNPNEANTPVQTNGPSPKGTHQVTTPIMHQPGSHQSGSNQDNGNDHSGRDVKGSHHASHLEHPAHHHHTAHGNEGSHDGAGGHSQSGHWQLGDHWQPSWQSPSNNGPVEPIVAYLRDHPVHARPVHHLHLDPSQLHEKVPGPELAHGTAIGASHLDAHKSVQELHGVHAANGIASAAGGGSHGHDHGGFADLIRAAQNPVQSGLVTTTQPAASDVHAHVSLAAATIGVTGHNSGAHIDLHAVAAAAPAAVHDVHIDQHAVAAPAHDHVAIPHH